MFLFLSCAPPRPPFHEELELLRKHEHLSGYKLLALEGFQQMCVCAWRWMQMHLRTQTNMILIRQIKAASKHVFVC